MPSSPGVGCRSVSPTRLVLGLLRSFENVIAQLPGNTTAIHEITERDKGLTRDTQRQ